MLLFCEQSPFLEMIVVSYCALDEQTLTLLLCAVQANCLLERGPSFSVSYAFFPLLECAVNSATHCTQLTSLHFFLGCVALPSMHGFAVGLGVGRGLVHGSVWLYQEVLQYILSSDGAGSKWPPAYKVSKQLHEKQSGKCKKFADYAPLLFYC